jgi:glycosyltransferase involved in cell wall biosynthesis
LEPTQPVINVSTSSPPCVYVDARPFSWTWFAGISRYAARLALALAARAPVRFFDEEKEILFPPELDWSQDQDIECWGRRIWEGERRPLGALHPESIGLYCGWRPAHRTFPYEVSVIHDFCPVVLPWAFTEGDRDGFDTWLQNSLVSDLVLADSHSTKSDAAWFSTLDEDRTTVGLPGGSLCVNTHLHRGESLRSDQIGLVVATIEPRKNAGFLLDWFQNTKLLPPEAELWWVGKLGWMVSEQELEQMANPPGGRRVRFLGNVPDAELCRIYQTAGWSIYPSRYEGFGFPILDSLRHGTPVLSSCASSMGEFDHPGVFFFDPQDAATVDLAWQRFQAAKPVTIPQARLEEIYNWDVVARTVLDVRLRGRRVQPFGRSEASLLTLPSHYQGSASESTSPGAATQVKGNGKRIGVEMFAAQTANRHRGIGHYSRNLVASVLASDTANEYVLYAQDGLPLDQIPTAPNATVHLLRPDAARGETTMTDAVERLTSANPDTLDVLLFLSPLELPTGYDLPAKPLNGLTTVAAVYDLIPLHFQEEYRWPGPDAMKRYWQALCRLKQYDALLTPSEWTRHELITFVGVAADRLVSTGMSSGRGSDEAFFVPDRTDPLSNEVGKLLRLLEIDQPFIYSAGCQLDMNHLLRMLDGFAMLPGTKRQEHRFVLTHDLNAAEQTRLREYARERGISDQLRLTGRLAPRAMRVLYQRCAAFVFPSSPTWFALPVLDALRCGAPVVAGNNSSQPEIVGSAGLLFDIANPHELAIQLTRLLDPAGPTCELRERAVVQARQFSWAKAAAKTLEVLTSAHARTPTQKVYSRVPGRRAPRLRLAFFSPLPPLQTAASEYSTQLLNELRRRYTIDVYHDSGYLPHLSLNAPDLGCYDHRLHARNHRAMGYHAHLYQVAPSHHHNYMREAISRCPGIVTLHDPSGAPSPIESALAVIVHSPSEARRHYIDSEQSWSRIADSYEEIIEQVAAGATIARPRLRLARGYSQVVNGAQCVSVGT